MSGRHVYVIHLLLKQNYTNWIIARDAIRSSGLQTYFFYFNACLGQDFSVNVKKFAFFHVMQISVCDVTI